MKQAHNLVQWLSPHGNKTELGGELHSTVQLQYLFTHMDGHMTNPTHQSQSVCLCSLGLNSQLIDEVRYLKLVNVSVPIVGCIQGSRAASWDDTRVVT